MRQIEIFSVLARFLEKNGLVNRRITGPDGRVDKDTVILERDLTPEGVALSWGLYIDRWLGSIDRGTPPEKSRVLQKGLDEIRRVGVHEALKKTRFYLYNDPDLFIEYGKPN